MTSARTQPVCKINNIITGCFDGCRACPGKNTERKIALDMYKIFFCLISKSNFVSFKKAIEEFKLNFKVVDNVISDKHDKGFIKYEYKLKKVEPRLTNSILYDIETFDTDRFGSYSICIIKLSKLSSKSIRDITQQADEYIEEIVLFSKELFVSTKC